MAGRTEPLPLSGLRERLASVPLRRVRGRLLQAVGPLLEAEVPGAGIGALCVVGGTRLAEVVGFKDDRVLLVPLEPTDGLQAGADVALRQDRLGVHVGDDLIGRVVDGLGRPIDGGPPLQGRMVSIDASPPDPLKRPVIKKALTTGVRAIDGMLTLGKGQRISIMAGSGVGKSTLLAMLAKNVDADVSVICLLGERGREVAEFIEETLGEEGRKRAVTVVVTSDQSPALQVKGAFLATRIAEHFRDQGKDVLLMVDSLTRLALAQRQIGLAAGEPPATRGFTPSVFALLPRVLERAGTAERGSITGIYTVLVEGDDVHDPVGDAVRGIVDGHVVLSRKLASHGHFPAIDVLGSLSRLMTKVAAPKHLAVASRVRDVMATWAENEELVRLGAYREGSSAAVDHAIKAEPEIRKFLRQGVDEPSRFDETLAKLGSLAT